MRKDNNMDNEVGKWPGEECCIIEEWRAIKGRGNGKFNETNGEEE